MLGLDSTVTSDAIPRAMPTGTFRISIRANTPINTRPIMRYVLQSSLSWSEELARYLFIWMAYFAISYGIKEMKHIKIDAALYLFPKRARKYILIVGDIIVMLFALFVIQTSFKLVVKIHTFGQVSAAMGIPMWIIYLAPLVGFILVVLRSVQTISFRIGALRAEKRGDTA